MKCPKCHFENPETQKFCGECGKALRIYPPFKEILRPKG